MEYLPLIALVLLLSGTALTAFLTYKFRKTTIESNAKIEELNTGIDIAIGRIESLNEEILKSSNDSRLLQIKLNRLAKIQDEKLSNSIELSEEISSYQTGGDSYVKFYIWSDPDIKLAGLNFLVCGDNPLNVVTIRLSIHAGIKDNLADHVLTDRLNEGDIEVVKVSSNEVIMKAALIRPGEIKSVLGLNEKTFRHRASFFISVNASNGSTVQSLSIDNYQSKDFPDGGESLIYKDNRLIDKNFGGGCR